MEEKDTGNVKEYTTNSEGKITTTLKAGKYEITEIETKEGYDLPENPTQIIQITKKQESYELTIENKKKQGKVVTHYYIEGTAEKVPSNVEGQVVEDVTQTGKVGDIYITHGATNVNDRYELKEVVGEENGTIEEGTKEIIYYYGLKQADLTLIKTNEQGEGLEGAQFKIENKESGKVQYVTTGENGEVIEKVEIGESIVTEEKAPEGYKLNKNPQTINVELNKENKITITNKKINYFVLNINKVDSETNEKIQGAKFNLSYTTQYGEEKTEEYESTEDGIISLNNLEDEIEYTLEEIQPAKGYVANTQKYRFIVHYEGENYELEMLEGTFNDIETEGKEIKCTIKNTPTLKVIKQGENGELLANAKFTITDEEGNEVRNGKGELVGQVEQINGENIRVVTTDEEGRIVENLEPGKYILTEVQAPKGYELPENEEDRKTEIEITSDGYAGTVIEKTEEIYANTDNWYYPDWVDFDSLDCITYPLFMDDGNLALVGGLYNDLIISPENTLSGRQIELKNTSEEDGLMVIMNQEGKVIEVYQNNSLDSYNVLLDMIETQNEKKIAMGIYTGTVEIPAENTANNQKLKLESKDDNEYTYMICYNSEGKAEWISDIEMIVEPWNNIINFERVGNKLVLQYDSSEETVIIPSEETTGEEIILNKKDARNPVKLVFNMDGKIEKALEVRWDIELKFNDETGISTIDGSTIVAGYSEDDLVVFDETETINGEKIELSNPGDGIIVKYNTEGKVEWAKNLGSINNFGGYVLLKEVETGYVGIVYYEGGIIIPAEETVNNQELSITSDQSNAMIKYNAEGKVEWLINDETIGMILQDPNPEKRVVIELRETEEGYVLIDNENGIMLKYKETYQDLIANKQETVTITNKAKDSTVLVHHYIKDTTTKLSEDVLITGKVGSDYYTKVATDIPSNYELVAEPANKDGKINPNQTEVIYYYQLKEPEITEAKIEKESTTEKITSSQQAIDYSINYTAKVDKYIGDATVEVIDYLPYKIDEEKSNLSGGKYNAEENTITWTEEIKGIDTFTEGIKEIQFSKNISIVYKDVDVRDETIENTVEGKLKLKTPEKESTVEDTKDIPSEYTTDITVNKVWIDNEVQLQRRPESIIIMVKDGDKVVQEKEISIADKLEGTENQWVATFTGLPKYDEEGQEIKYTVDEKEKNTDDLKFYEKEVTEVQDNQATIRNTFVKPEDQTEVTVEKHWEDDSNANEKRPTAIKLQVKDGNEVVAEHIVNKTNAKLETNVTDTVNSSNSDTGNSNTDSMDNSNNTNENIWVYTFEGLPKYNDNGEEIKYTADEEEIKANDLMFYEKEISGSMFSRVAAPRSERLRLSVGTGGMSHRTVFGGRFL